MLAVDCLLALVALIGHFSLGVSVFNRTHAMNIPRWLIKASEKLVAIYGAACPAILFIWWLQAGPISSPHTWKSSNFWPLAALIIYWLLAARLAIVWPWRRAAVFWCDALVSNHTRTVDVAEKLGGPPVGDRTTALLAGLPVNQIFSLCVNEKQLRIRRLPPDLEGFSVVHFSDLHLTGQLRPEFYHAVVEEANNLRGDLIAITGDIIDKPKCFDWLAPIFGKLQAQWGVHYVLGNHDLRVKDFSRLRKELELAGLVDLGGRYLLLDTLPPLLLAGNELPWFRPAANLSDAPSGPFKVLLSHSPDQFDWAIERDFDLMLAGHTHGGQIQAPWIGPIVSPSKFGVKYASGVFAQGNTVMHVSRGISGVQQLRINCPPELTRLVLHGG